MKPIPENIFDLSKVPEIMIFKNQKEIDSSKIVEKYNYYEKTSYKGPMNVRECEHYKSYELKFKDDQILVSIRKNDSDSLELEVLAFGNCPNFEIKRKITENELLLKKEYVFEKDLDCEQTNSNIKKLVLEGFLIKSITTLDNRIWTLK
ncbi:MAG: hypothetical protein KA278_02010 [Flavobacterium sp.]|nr:hypothetical protein [Flavobacterium sp.]